MPRPRGSVLTPAQMGEYHDPALLLRPINTGLVEQYAQALRDGAEFPAIILGTYTDEDGVAAKLMVDGNHIYRACQLAKKSFRCEVVHYDSLAAALVDQLKRNLRHGLRLTTAQRDKRIRELIEEHNMSTRQVADAVGMSNASVSRIYRGIQNGGGAGRRTAGAAGGVATGPRPLQARQFIRAIENIRMTLDKPEARAQALAEIFSPDREPAEVQRLVQVLRSVADDLSTLVKQPATTRRTRAAQAGQTSLLAA